MQRIALTTGDIDGVGWEVALRALREISLRDDQSVTVLLPPERLDEFKRSLQRPHTVIPFEALKKGPLSKGGIQLVASDEPPALWVEEIGKLCLRKKFDALVTGPLSKPAIRAAGLRDLGHTDILRRMSGKKELFMSFWGSRFNVVLVTGHVPLKRVPSLYTTERLLRAARLAREFARRLGHEDRPLAWLGLNPHAGDSGLIGTEDLKMQKLIGKKAFLQGPLVPDAAFAAGDPSRFLAFLCAYHDQGLIPFKLAHGFDEGVHVTLGLPFLRTSVDHGPAKDLVGTGKARYGSMKAALEMALAFQPPAR